MTIIDTHVHYNLPPLNNNEESVLAEAKAAGVIHSIVVGTNYETSRSAVELANNHQSLSAAVGLHPSEVLTSDKKLKTQQQLAKELANIEQLLANSTQDIVAIGEIGLDYYWWLDHEHFSQIKRLQEQLFREQLRLAQQFSLPVILHVRDKQDQAYHQIAQITAEESVARGVLHCVSGPNNYVETMLDRGFYVSFAGNVTYPSADALRQLAQLCPTDRILVETDAPYLAPQSHRGQQCQPAMIRETAEYLLEVTSVPSHQFVDNAIACFGLNIRAPKN